jgi:hypothetical protein
VLSLINELSGEWQKMAHSGLLGIVCYTNLAGRFLPIRVAGKISDFGFSRDI